MFKTERLEHQRQLLCRNTNQRFDIALQLWPTDIAGVDHVGVFTQFTEQFALVFDDVGQRSAIECIGL